MLKTFEFEEKLPSLPLPTLEHTLERYLDSVRPVVTDVEYATTKRLVEQFAEGTGRILHERLKAQVEQNQERNWLAKWWDKEIYFKWRLPIAPHMNMMGFDCTIPPEANSQLTRTSMHMHAAALLFETLREERYPISYVAQQPLAMYQLKHFFNTCRIPHKDCDKLVSVFRTAAEDARSPPTHTIVIRHGHIFTFDLYALNRLLTPPEIFSKLEEIIKLSDQSQGLGLGALTALPRDEWAELRDHLCQMSEQNKINLQKIEQAMIVYAFEDETPSTLTELARIGMLKNPQSRWFDRSNLYIVTRNGLVVENDEHSAYEATTPTDIGHHMQKCLEIIEKKTSWPVSSNSDTDTKVQELIFFYDSQITDAIKRATTLFYEFADNVEILVVNVNECTKDDIKRHVRIHPDSYFQLCLQLAYFKLHGHRPVSTYETASTRRFYRGRTETLRSCTQEVVAWCRAMTDPSNHPTIVTKRRKLFHRAAKRHIELMIEASNNEGCDRHFLGLGMMAQETGLPFELLDDPSWIKSGGSGNFTLSTSCVSFGTVTGGTSPMCLDGYGVFYRLGNDAITFAVSAYRISTETNAKALADALRQTLIEVKNSLMSSNL